MSNLNTHVNTYHKDKRDKRDKGDKRDKRDKRDKEDKQDTFQRAQLRRYCLILIKEKFVSLNFHLK